MFRYALGIKDIIPIRTVLCSLYMVASSGNDLYKGGCYDMLMRSP